MELVLGVVGDFWTPRAAQQALWVVTRMTPRKSAELFKRVGKHDALEEQSRSAPAEHLPELVASPPCSLLRFLGAQLLHPPALRGARVPLQKAIRLAGRFSVLALCGQRFDPHHFRLGNELAAGKVARVAAEKGERVVGHPEIERTSRGVERGDFGGKGRVVSVGRRRPS